MNAVVCVVRVRVLGELNGTRKSGNYAISGGVGKIPPSLSAPFPPPCGYAPQPSTVITSDTASPAERFQYWTVVFPGRYQQHRERDFCVWCFAFTVRTYPATSKNSVSLVPQHERWWRCSGRGDTESGKWSIRTHERHDVSGLLSVRRQTLTE